MKRFLSIYVSSIYGCLLCDKDQLLYAFLCHLLCLCYQTFHRNASEFTAKFRDDTVGAVFITAFCYLEVSEMSACCENTFAKLFRKVINIFKFLEMFSFHCFTDCLKDVSVGSCAKYCIYFRYFLNDLILITLCHTSCDNQDFTAPGFLVFCHLKDGVDALFLCVIDEAAGVHHNGLCFSFIIYDLEPVTCKKSEHFFGIYKVLVTA